MYVNSYSTVTDLVLQIFRITSPFASSSCNSLDKILGLIPDTLESSVSSLKCIVSIL